MAGELELHSDLTQKLKNNYLLLKKAYYENYKKNNTNSIYCSNANFFTDKH